MQAVLDSSDVLQQLGAAGHPNHQSTADDRAFELSQGLQPLQQQAADLRQTLVQWQDQIEAVHTKSPCSEFLSTHQLVAASQLLTVMLAGGRCYITRRLDAFAGSNTCHAIGWSPL